MKLTLALYRLGSARGNFGSWLVSTRGALKTHSVRTMTHIKACLRVENSTIMKTIEAYIDGPSNQSHLETYTPCLI